MIRTASIKCWDIPDSFRGKMRVCFSERADSDLESSEKTIITFNINIIEKVFLVYMKWYDSTYRVFIMARIWVDVFLLSSTIYSIFV